MNILLLSLVLAGIFYTDNQVNCQSIPDLTCTEGSDGEDCIKTCVTKFPGTTGVCRNGTCFCSDDPLDVKCGGDGSFGNSDCPDTSACQRNCCRAGYPSSICWFGFECKCAGKQGSV